MSKKTITLKSSDGECIEVDEAVALKSKTIANVIEDNGTDDAIPIVEVKSNILKLVIEYCKKHVESDSTTDEITEDIDYWDTEFMKMEKANLFGVLNAANYLEIKDLIDLSCQTIADIIKDKTVEEVRMYFNIENDLTEEEEEEIRQENSWAFDD